MPLVEPPPIARFEQVGKVYRRGLWPRGSVQALREVTLSIPSGSLYAVVGPNRSGKTTLVKLLLSIVHPSRGRIWRLGQPVGDRSTLAHIGYVHDSQAFPGYLTARGLLRYYGALTGVPRRDLPGLAAERLHEVGLADRADEPISGFSKGMLQRLALAQALVNDPELLVLDEPAEGMDLLARRWLHEVLRHRKARGRSAILVSHSLADVERICDHVAVLRCGELVFAGRVDELLAQSAAGGDDLESALEPLYAGAVS